jgi:alkyl sulfatase BDS1-like metallo-beta-lactamase superfamily hydrolase
VAARVGVRPAGGFESTGIAASGRPHAAFDDGEYLWVAEVVKHVVFAAPEHRPARELLAHALEQLRPLRAYLAR